MKILLVDDEREEREGIAYLIQKFRYPLEVVQAASGKEALEILQNQEIDILLTVGAGDICNYLPQICNVVTENE